MKTADLIPFILLELKENDKYGFELTKSIETKSNGQIIIKQPTLYTILKKLEKSKFISSYWEDSEIGGKRHYYKITENGLKQTLTLPSYTELLNSACGDTFSTETKEELVEAEKPQSVSGEEFSIFSHLAPAETILPSEEVFASNTLDTATELEINQNNTVLLKDEQILQDEVFASNKEVSKFAENAVATDIPKEAIKAETSLNSAANFIDSITPQAVDLAQVQYVDYIDFKRDANYTYAKKTAKKCMVRLFSSCLYLLSMIVLCGIIASLKGGNAIYYTSLILSVGCLVFIPTIYASKYENLKHKLRINKLNFSIKKHLIAFFIVEVFVFMICIITNIIMGQNSIGNIFALNNFSNIYSPMIMASTLFFDAILSYSLFKKTK